MKRIYIVLTIILCSTGITFGQSRKAQNANFFNTNMDYQINAFFSIGGSSPIGFPASIRKVESFNPSLQLGLEAQATKWLGQEGRWGIRVGVGVDGKGMKTTALVKNYQTEIVENKAKVRGYYTGLVQTNVKNTYFTVPVSAVYRLSRKWDVSAGLYVSALLDQQFGGYVSDGYFREGSPVGEKVVFDGDSKATYDFSSEQRKMQWGAQVGGQYSIYRHFSVFSKVNLGINNIFKKDFNALSFSLHNIYLDFGFGYRF